MAIYMLILSPVLLMALIITSATPISPSSPRNQDLVAAIEEMQRANYFTFVVLINMAKTDLIQENITFLMPNDRALSKNMSPENAVDDFLMRHSIPSPLLFDNLEYIPTGSMLPTLNPEFMLNISNNGRRSFYLNNVKLISPNICTAGSSIRCHGIDGVIQAINVPQHNTTFPSPTCSNSTTPTAAGEPPAMAAPPVDGQAPLTALSPTETNNNSPQKSSSFQRHAYGGLLKVLTCLMFFMFKFSI